MSSSSTSRRSGVHSSRGRHIGNSSNGSEGDGSRQNEMDINENRTNTNGIDHLDAIGNIDDALEEFERRSFPLSHTGTDSTIKANIDSGWQPVDSVLKEMINTITEVAEQRADVLAERDGDESDRKLIRYDTLCRQAIALQEETSIRKSALQLLRDRLAKGEKVEDAPEVYQKQVDSILNEVNGKTQRQRYGQSKAYERYRSKVWQPLNKDPMPPLIDIIPAEIGEVEEETDEIAVYGTSKAQYKCPLTLRFMENPMKSKKCQHAYEREAILDYLKDISRDCPAGCRIKMKKTDLYEDIEFTRECRKTAKREERRLERTRTQTETVSLD